MSLRRPRTLMISYVDNIELLTDLPSDAVDAISVLSKFAEFLGVPTDPSKTYSWSLDTTSRKALREQSNAIKQT